MAPGSSRMSDFGKWRVRWSRWDVNKDVYEIWYKLKIRKILNLDPQEVCAKQMGFCGRIRIRRLELHSLFENEMQQMSSKCVVIQTLGKNK